MAAYGGLRSLFEKPLPENPTLLEALSSWNHTHPKKNVDPGSCFTEIFGELHFQEHPVAPPAMVPWLDVSELDSKEAEQDTPSLDSLLALPKNRSTGSTVRRNASFCLKSSESLQLCTEGLGSESTVDADDMMKDGDAEGLADWKEKMDMEREVLSRVRADTDVDVGRPRNGPAFPPPISSIGRGGQPCFCFRSFREDGRFVLREIMIPGQELLRASREDGRLKLQFVHPDVVVSAEGEEEVEEIHEEEGKDIDENCKSETAK